MTEINYRVLDREMDRTKTQVFLGKNGSFLGSIMCSVNFAWADDIETAATNGVTLWWNPQFYLSLKPEVRKSVLLHELWHVALLHMLRRGSRDPRIWNYAADIVINNMLIAEGCSFEGVSPWADTKYTDWPTEDVYDALFEEEEANQLSPSPSPQYQWTNPISNKGDEGDIIEPGNGTEDGNTVHTIINNVVAATHAAAMSGCGNLPGEVQTTLKTFLSPKLPWDRLLNNFFNELSHEDYSWSRPNRRYQDMYLPGMINQREGLEHVIYYLDVSGSISDGDIIRFHSEFKYVKEAFEPEKMTMVQFDTKIQKEDVFLKDDKFEETHVIGRGGTSLICVRDHIIEHKPTAVVVFSDLECDVMELLPSNVTVPIIWVCLNNHSATVKQGTLVHLNER